MCACVCLCTCVHMCMCVRVYVHACVLACVHVCVFAGKEHNGNEPKKQVVSRDSHYPVQVDRLRMQYLQHCEGFSGRTRTLHCMGGFLLLLWLLSSLLMQTCLSRPLQSVDSKDFVLRGLLCLGCFISQLHAKCISGTDSLRQLYVLPH